MYLYLMFHLVLNRWHLSNHSCSFNHPSKTSTPLAKYFNRRRASSRPPTFKHHRYAAASALPQLQNSSCNLGKETLTFTICLPRPSTILLAKLGFPSRVWWRWHDWPSNGFQAGVRKRNNSCTTHTQAERPSQSAAQLQSYILTCWKIRCHMAVMGVEE